MQNSPREHSAFESIQHCSPKDLSLCSTKPARDILSFEEAARNLLLPLAITSTTGGASTLMAASHDPGLETLKAAKFLSGMEVRLIKVPKEILAQAIFIAYKQGGETLEKSFENCNPGKKTSVQSFAGLNDVSTPENHLLCSLLDHALAWNASDLHIHPTKDGLLISMRVAGEIRAREAAVHNHTVYNRLLNRIRVAASLDTSRKDPVQEGALIIPHLEGSVTARISMVPSAFGESLAIRFLRKELSKGIQELGFDSDAQDFLKYISELAHGLCVVSGSTGAGKTTTLYTLLQKIICTNRRIITIEDPIEAILPGVTQIQVNERVGLTFEKILKATLRQDPDVLVIGELRDAIVAHDALQAATSGHLVLATMHAGSLEDVCTRFEAWSLGGLATEVLKAAFHQKLKPRENEGVEPVATFARSIKKGRVKKS